LTRARASSQKKITARDERLSRIHASHDHHRVQQTRRRSIINSHSISFYRIDARTRRLDDTPVVVVVVVVVRVDDIILIHAMLAMLAAVALSLYRSSRTVDDGRRSTRARIRALSIARHRIVWMRGVHGVIDRS